MLKKILLPTIFVILSYGFWVSPDFKEIAAGVAVFLFGMLSLEEGFKAFSGGALERILKRSTETTTKSISFGFVATAIMQSSSLVSVLTISFIGAGLIGLTQGIGIIFGANIGTTTGAWLMAGFGLKVHISAYAMPMLVFGVIMIFQKSKSLKGFGYILTGLGFLFLGIHYMKEGFEAFKETVDLASLSIGGFKGLLIFIGIGVLATVIMQSSHATIVLILAALSVGQITYENALALTIGANIGTTITAIIGSLSSNIDGKRLAGAHFIFNVVTAIIAIIFIHQIMDLVAFISDSLGIASDNHTLRLAVFDSFFKIMGVVIFVPFINTLVNFLEKTLKNKNTNTNSKDTKNFDTVRYLNDSVLELPSTALAAITLETKHLYNNAFEIISHGLNLKRSNITSSMEIQEIIKIPYSSKKIDIDDYYNRNVKGIYGQIIDFSTRAKGSMSPEYIEELYKIKLANRDIVEAIKDTKHLQKNMLRYIDNPNIDIQKEYMKLKIGLAELLRNVNIIALTDEIDVKVLLLSKTKLHIKRYDIIANGTLDNLIRNNLVTNEMATSLMNDSNYAYAISKNLIAMAEVIFIDSINDILISDEDIETILQKGDQ